MISSKADFFFFSPPLESELESFLFTEVEDEDDAALSALAPRTELKEDRSTQLEAERLKYFTLMYLTQRPLYLDFEGPATEEQAPKLKATARQK